MFECIRTGCLKEQGESKVILREGKPRNRTLTVVAARSNPWGLVWMDGGAVVAVPAAWLASPPDRAVPGHAAPAGLAAERQGPQLAAAAPAACWLASPPGQAVPGPTAPAGLAAERRGPEIAAAAPAACWLASPPD
jgi:hypothetical protein